MPKIFDILLTMSIQFILLINTTQQTAPKNTDSTVSLEHSITFEKLTAKTVTAKSVWRKIITAIKQNK